MATTFVELFAELKTEALNAVESVKNQLISFEHALVPVVESDITLVLSQFKAVAVNIVTTLATQEFANLSGTQKNTITVTSILSAAEAAGKTIAVQDAQLLAQQAYNAVVTSLPK
jgi:hypothetical protein